MTRQPWQASQDKQYPQPRANSLQRKGNILRIVAVLLGSQLLLAGCGSWPFNQGAQDKGAQETGKQAESQQQLEQKAAAQALKLVQLQARKAGQVEGHKATVNCLRGERAQTDGSELRCEDWLYVQQNYDGGYK